MDQFTEALQKSKAVNRMVDSFVNKDIVAQDSLQLDELEKGKAGQIGEIRTWGGKKYQKTPKGWRPVKAGAQSSQKEASKKEGSEKYEFVLRGKIDPIHDKDWEKKASGIDWDYADMASVGQTVAYLGKVDNSDHPYAVRYYSPNGKNSGVMRLTEADYKANLERDRKLQASLDQKAKETEKKLSDGWKEGFGGGVIWKEYSDSDFKVVEIKKDDKNKYHLNIGGYKAPNAITESEAVEKKISEIRSQSYDSLEEAKMMADIVSQMKYSDIVKEAKASKEKNHLSVTKAWISKYEEKISAEIKKLQERLETAKKQAETTAKVEAAIPDVFKKAGLNFKSATLILNEDNPERQYFNVEAGIPGRFMVKGARGSNSANARAYENALAKAAILSSMVESFFEEKGLTVKASINPYSLQYKDSSEKNNSTAEIDLKISNYGK